MKKASRLIVDEIFLGPIFSTHARYRQ